MKEKIIEIQAKDLKKPNKEGYGEYITIKIKGLTPFIYSKWV